MDSANALAITAFSNSVQQALSDEHFDDVSRTLRHLDLLQEQPQLLDSHIVDLVDRILQRIIADLEVTKISSFVNDLYHVLYQFTKIRGAKVIGAPFRSRWDLKLTSSELLS